MLHDFISNIFNYALDNSADPFLRILVLSLIIIVPGVLIFLLVMIPIAMNSKGEKEQNFDMKSVSNIGGWKDTFRTGGKLILHSLKVFQKYPIFIVPILAVWLIYAPTVIYLKYFFPWTNFDTPERLGICFFVIFIFSFLILLSCDIVLDLISQIEKGNPSLGTAYLKAIGKDLFKIIPLALIWATIWFVLTIIQALLSKDKGEGKEDFNTQNAAATLAGYGQISFSSALIEALNKGVRMAAFTILPAIAWEDLSFPNAFKKGLMVIKTHLGNFASGYALTYAAAIVIFLPPGIICELGIGRHGSPPMINFPEWVWVAVIIYSGLAWSFCMYLEQMFTAQLYLWHLKWEESVLEAKKRNQPLPLFKDTEQPALLAKVPNLFN